MSGLALFAIGLFVGVFGGFIIAALLTSGKVEDLYGEINRLKEDHKRQVTHDYVEAFRKLSKEEMEILNEMIK